MNKRNIIITILSVLILVCVFAFARTTTTDLGLTLPTWKEGTDILDDYNANFNILEDFANDPLEFDTEERLEDRVGAMFTGNTETGLTVTYQDANNTIDVVIGDDDIVQSMLKCVNDPNDEEIFTYEATTGDFEWHTLAELSIQPLDAGLTSIAGLTTAANKMIYATALDTYAVADLTPFARSILDDADEATFKATVNLEIGTDVQAYDAALTSISGLTYAEDSFIKLTAEDTYAVRTLSEVKEDLDVDDLEDLTNAVDSSCIVTGGVVSEGTNAGTFKVSAITEAYLRTSASATAPLVSVTLAEQDNQTITAANTTYYVILNYGTPCTITISETPPNGYNAIPLGKVMKNGSNDVHYISGGYSLGNGVAKLWKRAKALREIELTSGNVIAYSGTNNFTMTSGTIYAGGNKINQDSYDSASTQFTYVYDDGGGGWTESDSNTIDYSHYDDGDGTLGDVANNKYSCHWVYRHVDDGHVYVVYGRDSYTLADAEVALEPDKPIHLTDFGCLIGKIIAPIFCRDSSGRPC